MNRESSVDEPYQVSVEPVFRGRSRNECWFEPSAALVPSGKNGATAGVIVTASQLTGNDVGPSHYTWSHDGGARWSNPAESQSLQVNEVGDGIYEKPWLAPFYHRGSDALLLIGRTCFTQDLLPVPGVKGETHALWSPRAKGIDLRYDLIYSWWDPEAADFVPWDRVVWREWCDLPAKAILTSSEVCQRVEEPDGTILSPVMVRSEHGAPAACGVMRLTFDGERLHPCGLGNLIACSDERGFVEPSLIRHAGRYLLTIRNDLRGYVAASENGLDFAEAVPWQFDDGEELGSYNTQQHWLAHGERLYLVYTRRSELSGGVVRHRAPLFMAEVDSHRLCVLRDTERVLIPERGARMGNFATLAVSDDEAWVITGEWLQSLVPGYEPGMPFYTDAVRGDSPYNRIQYIGDLLLARITFA